MKHILQCCLIIITFLSASAHYDDFQAVCEQLPRDYAQHQRMISHYARSQIPQPRELYYHKVKRQCPALYNTIVNQTVHIRDTLATLLTSPTIDQLVMACSTQYHCTVGSHNFAQVADLYNKAYHDLCEALLPYLCTSDGIFVGLQAYNHDGSLDSQQKEANVYRVARIIADFIERADPDHYDEHIKALADKNVPGFKDLYETLIETDYGFIILNHIEAAGRLVGRVFSLPSFLRKKITLETINNNPLNQTIQRCITAFNNNDLAQAYDLLKPYEQNAHCKKSERLHWAIIRNRLKKEVPDYHHRYSSYCAQRHYQPAHPEQPVSFSDFIDPFDETIRLFLQKIPQSKFMQTLEEFSLVRNVITDRYKQGYLPYLACCIGDYVIGLAHGALNSFINTVQLAYDLKHKPMTTLGTACYHLVKASGLVGLLLTDFAPSEELACYDPFFNEYEVQVKTMIGKTLLSSLDCNDPKALGHAIGTLTADIAVQEVLLNSARTLYTGMRETAELARQCNIGPQLEQALADTFTGEIEKEVAGAAGLFIPPVNDISLRPPDLSLLSEDASLASSSRILPPLHSSNATEFHGISSDLHKELAQIIYETPTLRKWSYLYGKESLEEALLVHNISHCSPKNPDILKKVLDTALDLAQLNAKPHWKQYKFNKIGHISLEAIENGLKKL